MMVAGESGAHRADGCGWSAVPYRSDGFDLTELSTPVFFWVGSLTIRNEYLLSLFSLGGFKYQLLLYYRFSIL